jgi:hypothetical protein
MIGGNKNMRYREEESLDKLQDDLAKLQKQYYSKGNTGRRAEDFHKERVKLIREFAQKCITGDN